ncbi:trehalase-associated protein [Suhomyces tanzawaensis NRRL Y-17324]|uniref:Trehalase-associated protein n=1 Tax=Suhomyces tanzawaensis NRRL Y-17324 TaxID=984487 RepID=A0A1E4SRH0_9ASCO|nr:trehalase-associated protein [Suhomyces tanzawaensis NRRL Y-17324]ODV82095.1 trehalase-associated protein [Suhomyces tanzawaensis NRRL Y-17324]
MSLSELIKSFQCQKILKSNPQTKSVVLLGQISKSNDAIITIEKSHFVTPDESYDVASSVEQTLEINHNDIYYWSNSILKQDLEENPGAKLNLIYPATETHIRKYGEQPHHYVVETPQMYKDYAVPYIESMKGDRIKWVYNILFEGKESETFVHHDKDLQTGFVLLPDMKWDTINLDTLYLCCIVNRTDISSVRDLNESHVQWLIDLQQRLRKLTFEKYSVEADQLRIFAHYHPSYYHFHLHIVNIKHPGLGNGIAVGKAILLDDIIENIQLAGDYYQKKNIGFLLGENHGLWQIEGYRKSHEERQ